MVAGSQEPVAGSREKKKAESGTGNTEEETTEPGREKRNLEPGKTSKDERR